MAFHLTLKTRDWRQDVVHTNLLDTLVLAQIMGCAVIDEYCPTDKLHHKIEFLETDLTWWDEYRLEVKEIG